MRYTFHVARQIPEISVFLPVFKEEENIEKTILQTKEILEKKAEKWELLVINDGSTDKTSKILSKIVSQDKRIKMIVHEKNLGYGATLSSGFYNSKYKWIAFTDSDGQFDFSEIDNFFEKQNKTGADLIIGYYKKRQVSKFKIVTSKLWEFAVWLLFGLRVKDIDCGFKLVRKEVVDKIPELESQRGAFISSEFLIKAKKAGFKIAEVPVTHYPRLKGEGTGRNFNVIVKSFVDLVSLWVKSQTLETWILLFIILVAAFFRLYKINEYMTFLGDEGRDATVVRRFLTQARPPLIGPGTSIGNMYLGPLYYYMMALPLLLANFNPVGPAIQIAVLGVITVWFVWYAFREWFPTFKGATLQGVYSINWGALIAAGLFAISPAAIIYSRSSWNPNIMPFFALLSMWAVWKVWREHKFFWLAVLGISYAFVLQSHYMGLLLAPTIFIFLFLTFVKIWKDKKQKSYAIRHSLYAIALFLVLMSPLFFFDLRHNWINARALYTFLTVRQETVSIKPWGAIPKIPEMLTRVNFTLVSAKTDSGAKALTAGFFLAFAILIYIIIVRKKDARPVNPAYWFLFTWLGVGLVGFGLYKQNIYDHYLEFLFVVPFILIGAFLSVLFSKGKVLKFSGIGILIYLAVINLINNPLLKEPNNLLKRSQEVSRKIIKEAGGNPMNLAVIADSNYEAGYQYFVELYGGRVLEIDAQNPSTVAGQLFAVCELIPTSKCNPTQNPKAQIASFGWSRVAAQWELDGVIIYKLSHTINSK